MFDPKKADVRAIESELAELWRNISEAKQGTGAVLRVCLLNLIVVAQSQEEADAATQVIANVTQDHPCRAVVLFVDPDLHEDVVEAWVTAHCQLPNEKSEQVCCEQIFIRTSGWQSTGMVAPLLVADLPVFVWWTGELNLDSPLSQRLQFLADRWIFDSARQSRWAVEQATSLVDLQGLAVSDIHWSRLTPWRETIAQFFDPPPQRAELEHLSGIEIHATDVWQAWMLAGWFASRLGWQPVERVQRGDGVQVLPREKQGVADARPMIEIQPTEGEGIRSVSLRSEQAHFLVEQDSNDSLIASTEFVSHDTIRRHIALHGFSLAQYVCGELEILGHDKVYEESIGRIPR